MLGKRFIPFPGVLEVCADVRDYDNFVLFLGFWQFVLFLGMLYTHTHIHTNIHTLYINMMNRSFTNSNFKEKTCSLCLLHFKISVNYLRKYLFPDLKIF